MTATKRGEISRGSREPQGFLKLRRSQRQLGGTQSSRRATVGISESAERASKEAKTASMAAGSALEAAGRALGGKGGRNDNEINATKSTGKTS